MSKLCAIIVVAVSTILGTLSVTGTCAAQNSDTAPIVGSGKIQKPHPAADMPQIWYEVQFIQIDRKEMTTVEEKLGFSLDPIEGKVILDSGERKTLLDAIDEMPSTEYLGAASSLTCTGLTSKVRLVEEIRYPGQFPNPAAAEKKEDDDDDTEITATVGIDSREVGVLVTVKPTLSTDGKIINTFLAPEISTFHRWLNFAGYNFSQPVITCWNTSTIWLLKDGSTVVLKSIPARPFRESEVFEPRLRATKLESKVSLIIYSTKLVSIDTEEGAE